VREGKRERGEEGRGKEGKEGFAQFEKKFSLWPWLTYCILVYVNKNRISCNYNTVV